MHQGEVFAERYRILRRIAAGGMGAVYEARHLETERPCALKVMLPHVAENEAMRERFRLEARAAALVSSTHVVDVLDAGVDEATGSPFLVMELLRGEDLGRRITRLGPLPASEVARLVREAARGLDALHKASIVHRDLKPSNLFLAEREGEAARVKVVDLGVAKRVAETAATTAAVGTPYYMAPEQLQNGKITPATDVYALGMVAYTLLVGREYWAAEAKAAASTLAFALEVLGGPIEAATDRAAALGVTLPDAFDEWFFRATARDAGERFPSAPAAAEALSKALGEATAEATEALAATAIQDRTDLPTPTDEGAKTRTLTLGGAVGSTTPNPAAPDATKEPHAPKRRSKAVIVAIGVAALAAASALTLGRSRKPEGKPVVAAIACAPATMTGKGASPALADALGKGACARLAVELGVAFGEPGGSKLEVRAEVAEAETRVTLSVAGIEAVATGKTPIVATNQAIADLTSRLDAPPMPPERAAAFGEADGASARRIERVMRRKAYGFTLSDEDEARHLTKTNPGSALAQAMLACALRKTDVDASSAAKDHALASLSALPPARARLVEGLLDTYIPKGQTKASLDHGVSLLLKSYSELSEDPDFAALFASCGCIQTEQTFPMVDWLAERWRAQGLPILTCAFSVADEDPARQEKYLRWMRDVLPETRGRFVPDLLEIGRLDEARAALEEKRALGAPTSTRASLSEDAALVALASLDPSAALAAAEVLFGEPNPRDSSQGAIFRIEALLLAGRVSEARSSFKLEIGRRGATGEAEDLALLGEREAAITRLMGRTRAAADRKSADEAAAAYRAATNPYARRESAFEGALALEAIGAKDEAEKAYALSLEQPWRFGFEAIAARVRLAQMARAAGREDAARALEAIVDRAWAGADPALRDAVRQMK